MSIISPALILITIIYYPPFWGGTFLPPPCGQDGASIRSMLPHWTQEMDMWPSLDQSVSGATGLNGQQIKCCWYPTHTAQSFSEFTCSSAGQFPGYWRLPTSDTHVSLVSIWDSSPVWWNFLAPSSVFPCTLSQILYLHQKPCLRV